MPATDPSTSDTDGATERWASTTSHPRICEIGVRPELLDRLHRATATHAVDETHVRHSQLERKALGVVALRTDRCVR